MSTDRFEQGLRGYIDLLHSQSPIVSTSHYYLRGLYDWYGETRVDEGLQRIFDEMNEEQAQ